MRKTALTTGLFIFAGMILLPALSFGLDWTAYGVSVSSTSGKTTVLSDASGNTFSVSESEGTATAETATQIVSAASRFIAWENIYFTELSFSITEDGFEAVIVPAKIVNGTEDYAAKIPAGLYFYYDENGLAYNFKMLEGTYFMTVKGFYINESTLVEKMGDAVADPVSYIQREDFDYVIAKLDTLEDSVNANELSIYDNSTAIEANAATTAASVADLEASDATLLAMIDALSARLDELESENTSLKASIVSLVNHGALSAKPTEVSDKVIEAVVALKTESPALTVDEVVEKLKADGVEAGKREVLYIFVIYFGEYQ